MLDPIPRYYYHIGKLGSFRDETCTVDECIGSQINFIPRSYSSHRAFEEPRTKRVCVAPTVWQSFLAVPWDSDISVWRSKDKIKCHFVPKKVKPILEDVDFTDEHWLKKKTPFICIGIFDYSYIKNKLSNRDELKGFNERGVYEVAKKYAPYVREAVEKEIMPFLVNQI